MKSDRPTRVAFRAEDTPPELIEALANADYSHLSDHPLATLSLRQLYNEALTEPVPHAIKELLDRLS